MNQKKFVKILFQRRRNIYSSSVLVDVVARKLRPVRHENRLCRLKVSKVSKVFKQLFAFPFCLYELRDMKIYFMIQLKSFRNPSELRNDSTKYFDFKLEKDNCELLNFKVILWLILCLQHLKLFGLFLRKSNYENIQNCKIK